MSIINTASLKPIIIPFDTGWNFVQYMITKIMCLMLFYMTKFNSIVTNIITQMHVSAKLCLLMYGTFYPSGTLHYDINETKRATGKSMVLENTLATFVLARNRVLKNAIVSQNNTIGREEKFQDLAQLPFIVKYVRR